MVRDKIDLIPRIKELYQNGENIIQFLKGEGGRNSNTTEDILISYDFQAGSYIKFTKENVIYTERYTRAIASVLNSLGSYETLLEAGAGEATTLGNVAPKLHMSPVKLFGFDISWSRIASGLKYLDEKSINAALFVADLFNIPLADNSIDIVYTSHSIEPNGGMEKEALMELYRVARKYLILLEPTDEFANEEGKMRMKRNGYIENLRAHIDALGYNLIRYKPFEVTSNALNPTGLYVILKEENSEKNNTHYCCPVSKCELTEFQDHFFSYDSLVSYPKVNGIPCLCSSYGILTTKHE